jgi:hypothetical protein
MTADTPRQDGELRKQLIASIPFSWHSGSCVIWNVPDSTPDDCDCPTLHEQLDAILKIFQVFHDAALRRQDVESLSQLPKLYRNCGLTLKYTGALWQVGYTNIHGCWVDAVSVFGDTPQSAIGRLAAAQTPVAEGEAAE